MPFKFEDFVDVAEDILTGACSADEGHLRVCVGRAYYGPYGLLRTNLITACGDCFGKSGKHRRLIAACTAAPDPQVKRIGLALHRLQLWRVDADYEPHPPTTSSTAETAIDLARRTCDKIGKLSATHLQQIFDSM